MKTIYYKIITVWCKYPWQDVVDERYVEFYDGKKGKLKVIQGLRLNSNTSLEEKQDYLISELGLKNIKVCKIK